MTNAAEPIFPTTRLTPSPTGALHLGNARTFLINWALAKRREWRVRLRVDDLEGPRVKPGAARQAEQDLAWLGLTWDGPIIRQSDRRAEYDAALARLGGAGLLYSCDCPRSTVAAGSPGAAEDGAMIYGGRCRGRDWREPGAVRLRVGGDVRFEDEFLGRVERPAAAVGDVVVRKSSGEVGYQLASVVDDAIDGITHVVRGDDLLASTVRQAFVRRALGIASSPAFVHVPLVVGLDGRKLAKRHGDTRLAELRAEGVSAGRVRGMLARWSGLGALGECSLDEWVGRFDLTLLPRGEVIYDDGRDRPRA